MPVNGLRILAFEDLMLGMSESIHRTVEDGDVVGFAELSGDHNPIHLNDIYAAKSRFGRRIAHGMYTASLISAVIGTRLPGPGAIYMSQSLKFMGPVLIGDTVAVEVTVAELMPEKSRARLSCRCTVSNETVLEGDALVKVPTRAELASVA